MTKTVVFPDSDWIPACYRGRKVTLSQKGENGRMEIDSEDPGPTPEDLEWLQAYIKELASRAGLDVTVASVGVYEEK